MSHHALEAVAGTISIPWLDVVQGFKKAFISSVLAAAFPFAVCIISVCVRVGCWWPIAVRLTHTMYQK